MASQHQAMFEAPASHEAAHYSNPYSNPEFEDEWENHEAAHYSNPEFENEWESPEAAHYSNPEFEWENPEAAHYSNPYSNPEAAHYSNPEFENEWESPEAAHYSNPEFEWESPEAAHYSNPYSNPEFEDEGEFFFKGLRKGLKSLAKVAGPLAKRLAPFAAKALVGMIPGVGAIAGPLAGKLTSALLKEGEMEAAQMEAEFFGTNEAEAEVGQTEAAHEAALTEFLAAQAAEAANESEAEAAIGATLPITISIMGGRRALRRVMPVMAQANATLASTLRSQGPGGRQLVRLIPPIQRRAIATLKAASRAGRPIDSATAIRAMAAATRQVMSNPQTVQRAMVRNAVLRQRTAPPNPRRMATRPGATNGRCPNCATPLSRAR